ncbi:MAG TPA: aminopeptidase [Solirubrobacterales bacterium]|jgi:leucyl aminopeptidase (aminopeptidase T)|nr:aminopeptidase [Solirubrobacterales bacterium]
MASEELDRAVAAVVRDCLGVKPGEEVLVVANPATEGIGEAMRAESERAGADAVLAVMAERATHGTEPPAGVAAAMAAADVALVPTVQSLSHTEARRAATGAGARIATLPSVTEEMLARVMSADMAELRRRGDEVARRLSAASEAVFTCPNGSDLHVDLEGRTGLPDDGVLTEPGAFGNLPCGEGFIAPAGGEGTLIVDGSLAGIGLAAEPVALEVEAGHLTSARGGQGMEFMELLTAYGEDGTNLAELGIGTNEKAILTGIILEDEKILGTAHVAFGASAPFGGNVQVPIHLDCIVTRPTVELDGEPLIRDGELLV